MWLAVEKKRKIFGISLVSPIDKKIFKNPWKYYKISNFIFQFNSSESILKPTVNLNMKDFMTSVIENSRAEFDYRHISANDNIGFSFVPFNNYFQNFKFLKANSFEEFKKILIDFLNEEYKTNKKLIIRIDNNIFN